MKLYGREPLLRALCLGPNLWATARPVAQLFAIVVAVSSAGCSVLDGAATGAATAPKYNANTLYLTSPRPVTVRTDYMDRYACAAAKPLVCECTSRIVSECTCRC
jgi:hypothetical protein